MTIKKALTLPLLLLIAAIFAFACADDATPTPTAEMQPEPAKALVYAFSNTSPHITEMDGETNEVLRTAGVPGLRQWGWVDDNYYFTARICGPA